MIHCQLCDKIINSNDLNSHYKITLGNLFSGRFYGNKEIYYHKECLETVNKSKKELTSEIY